MADKSVTLEMPDGRRAFTDLVLDYTGTLAFGGVLIQGVDVRLKHLATLMRVTVMTADTFGTAAAQLEDLPVDIVVIKDGKEKAAEVKRLGGQNVVAIGNGRNDVPMMAEAGLSIAVIGPEGAAGELVHTVDIVIKDICDALDLINHPLRLKATLRD